MALEFDSATHTYTLDGVRVPSVTGVLDRYVDFSDVPLDRLEAARIFGQHVHEAVHLLVREELDWASLDPALVPYVRGAQRFLEESGVTVIASELRVASKKMKVAGTLDMLGHLRGFTGLFDWKTPTVMPVTVGPQTAGYDLLYREEHGGRAHRRFGVLLKPNDYRLKPLNDTRDHNIFISCVNTHHFFGSKRNDH